MDMQTLSDMFTIKNGLKKGNAS